MSDNKTSGVEIRLDLPYGGGPARNLCVDVYLPAGAEMHPALLCLHGGAWLRGLEERVQKLGLDPVSNVDPLNRSVVSGSYGGHFQDRERYFA